MTLPNARIFPDFIFCCEAQNGDFYQLIENENARSRLDCDGKHLELL